MKNKKIIVKCLVKEIHNDKIIIIFANKEYKCPRKDITDYNTDLSKMFTVNKSYKFSLIETKDGLRFSYKMYRPKLKKNRFKPTPTISGFKNLNQNMHDKLKEYKLEE